MLGIVTPLPLVRETDTQILIQIVPISGMCMKARVSSHTHG